MSSAPGQAPAPVAALALADVAASAAARIDAKAAASDRPMAPTALIRADNAESEVRREIGIRLTILARLLRHNFDREMATLNITRSQWGMIAVVARTPGATQRMIAEMLEISEASAGRLVDRLCGEGLLERRERNDDRRARAVYLTAAAEPLLQQLAMHAKAGEEHLFAGFSDKDITALAGYLDRLYANASRT